MKKLLFGLIFLASTAQAENICYSATTGFSMMPLCTAGSALEVSITGVTGVQLDNNAYLTATDAAGTGTISLLKADATDDTVLNAKTGELIKLSENGTAGTTIDPSTNGYTFASLAEFGSSSLTDGIDAAYFSDGTAKAAMTYDGSHIFNVWATTNHAVSLGVNNAGEVYLTTTAFSPYANAGSALGGSTLGWLGLYLSDGTDKWSLVPGVNLLTLAAGTSNGSDDQTLDLGAGGACSQTRGACLEMAGNDVGGADAGGGVTLYTGGGTAGIRMYTGAGANLTSLKWTFANTGDLTQDATNGGNIVMAKAATGIQLGTVGLTADVTTALTAAPQIYDFTPATGTGGIAIAEAAADALGGNLSFFKSRKVDGTADTIVNASDVTGRIWFYGADGANFVSTAMISSIVDAAPGSGDMPGALIFYTTPDAAAAPTQTLKLGQDKAATFAGALKSTATNVGWVIRTGADTDCDTTCTAAHGCVFGQNTAALGYNIVACNDATADVCVCSF